jgi:flagellar motor switch protein FliN/FliY
MNDQKQLINIFVENWTSVYNTILGRDVRITVDSVEMKSKNEVKAAFGDFQSFVRLSYKEKKERNLVMAMSNKLVSIIANLMIGLDTFKDEIGADDRGAFEEAVNQMFSACQVPLQETLGLDMKFKDISFVEPVDAAALIGAGKSKTWNCTVDLQDAAVEQFMLVTPPKFGEVEKKTAAETAVGAPVEAPPVHVPTAAAPSPLRGEFAYEGTNIDMLLDVELPVTVRIGSTEMRLIDIMKLGMGSIIELKTVVDDPVEILVNDKLVAKGDVVVCDGKFAVRVTEVRSRAERIKSLA